MTLLVLSALSGCNGGADSEDDPELEDDPAPQPTEPERAPMGETRDWYRPGVDTTWQWQLSGPVNTGYAVKLYDIDLYDTPASQIKDLQAAGKKVICYFSAGTYEDYRPDADAFPRATLGNPVEGYAQERWLDIRSPEVRRILLARLDLAAQKGCDGVEPDNVDGYTNRPGFNLTAQDQLDFNRFLAEEAHRRALAVGLKNDVEQIPQLLEYFDFAVNEQCHQYDECDALKPFVAQGKAVLNTEYADAYVFDAAQRQALCADSLGRNLRTLVLPQELDDSFRFSCDS